MGGYGSGGHNRTHATVDKYSRVDSFAFWRYIKDCRCFFDWGVMKYHSEAILYDLEAETAQIRMGKRYRPLELSWVLGVDGCSLRAYFYCPHCKGRVRYLYNFHGYHVCRHCLKANYRSQQTNRGLGVIRRRMQNLVENELGYIRWRIDLPGAGISELRYIPRPRYMRYKKYSRLMMQYRQLQDEYTRELLKVYGAFLPPG